MENSQKHSAVQRQLLALVQMSRSELVEKWHDLFGRKPPNYGIKFMQKRLAYRIQELFYGGLPENLRKVMESKSEDPLANNDRKKVLRNGTILVRIWHKKRYEVIVCSHGYEYDGMIYRSLSAVAQKITGAHWNGNRFFQIEGDKE